MVDYINPDIQRTLEEVFSIVPLKPASMMIVSIDGAKLAEIGKLADYIKTIPIHDEKRRRPQAMTGAMSSLGERISKELFGTPQEAILIESEEGVVYCKTIGDKAIIYTDWRDDIGIGDVLNTWDAIQQILETISEIVEEVI